MGVPEFHGLCMWFLIVVLTLRLVYLCAYSLPPRFSIWSKYVYEGRLAVRDALAMNLGTAMRAGSVGSSGLEGSAEGFVNQRGFLACTYRR